MQHRRYTHYIKEDNKTLQEEGDWIESRGRLQPDVKGVREHRTGEDGNNKNLEKGMKSIGFDCTIHEEKNQGLL